MKIKILPKRKFNGGPVRSHYNDAGADVKLNEKTTIEPHSTIKVPLGYGIQLPDGFQAIIQPRSSMTTQGIITQIAPIDSGYTGEIHAIVSNLNGHTVRLSADTRIGQLVIMPIVLAEFTTELGDERGDGGFGSTGK